MAPFYSYLMEEIRVEEMDGSGNGSDCRINMKWFTTTWGTIDEHCNIEHLDIFCVRYTPSVF